MATRVEAVITGDASSLERALRGAAAETDRAADRMSNFKSASSQAFLAVGVAVVAFGKISVDAYTEQQVAIKRLELAMANTGNNTLEVSKAFAVQSNELRRLTQATETQVTAAQAMLLSSGLTVDQVLLALPAIADLSAATGLDFPTAAEAFNAALRGELDQLETFVPLVDENNNKILEFDEVLRAVTKSTQGAGEALAEAAGPAEVLKDNFNNLKAVIGNQLSEPLADITMKLADMVDRFANLSPEVQSSVIQFGALLFVLGAVKQSGAWEILLGVPGMFLAIYRGVALVALILGGPLMLAIAAVALAIGALVYYWDDVVAAWNEAWEGLPDDLERVAGDFEAFGDRIGEWEDDVAQRFTDSVDNVQQWGVSVGDSVASWTETVGQRLTDFSDTVVNTFSGWQDRIAEKINPIREELGFFFEGLKVLATEKLSEVFGPAIDNLKTKFNEAKTTVTEFFNNLFNKSVEVAPGVRDNVGIIGGAVDSASAKFREWRTTASSVLDGIRTKVSEVGSSIAATFRSKLAEAQSAFSSFQQSSAEVGKRISDSVNNWLTSVGNYLGPGLRSIMTKAQVIWSSFSNSVASIMTSIGNAVKSGSERAWNAMVSAVTNAVNRAKAILNSLMSFLKSIWDYASRVFQFITSVGRAGSSLSVPRLAEGGIVTGPTLALIGEAGPEAVVPLGRSFGSIPGFGMSGSGSGGGVTVHVTVQGSVLTAGELSEQIRMILLRLGRANGSVLGRFA